MDLRLYASIFLANDRSELLMVKEGKPAMHGFWNLPGGKLEIGEDFSEAAMRETLEEAGIEAQAERLMKIFWGKDMDSLHAVFQATQYTGSPAASDKNILDVRWIPLDEVKRMEHELFRPHKILALLETYEKGMFHDKDVFHRWKMLGL